MMAKLFLRGGEMRATIIILICLALLAPAVSSWSAEPSNPTVGSAEPSNPTVGTEREQEKKAARPLTALTDKGVTTTAAPSKFRLILEPSFEYDHFSGQNVAISGFTIFEAILIGQVVVEKIKRDIYIPAMTMRLGYKDAEISLRIPYIFRHDQSAFPTPGGSGTIQQATFNDNSLGDLQPNFYYHAITEGKWRPWVPDVIFRLGGSFPTGQDPYNLTRENIPGLGVVSTQFPTGTGHYGMTAGATFVKSADPAILFLSAAYYYNFARHVGTAGDPPIDFGNIKIGNSFEYSIGFVLAIQEKFSVNFALNQRLFGRTTQNGHPLPDSNINAIAFNIGATYVISPRFSAGFLSRDRPDPGRPGCQHPRAVTHNLPVLRAGGSTENSGAS